LINLSDEYLEQVAAGLYDTELVVPLDPNDTDPPF
jgi:hypothetical protein